MFNRFFVQNYLLLIQIIKLADTQSRTKYPFLSKIYYEKRCVCGAIHLIIIYTAVACITSDFEIQYAYKLWRVFREPMTIYYNYFNFFLYSKIYNDDLLDLHCISNTCLLGLRTIVSFIVSPRQQLFHEA